LPQRVGRFSYQHGSCPRCHCSIDPDAIARTRIRLLTGFSVIPYVGTSINARLIDSISIGVMYDKGVSVRKLRISTHAVAALNRSDAAKNDAREKHPAQMSQAEEGMPAYCRCLLNLTKLLN